jgi:hypothetical protein
MKKIIILFVLSLTFWGCSKEEEPVDNTIKVETDDLSLAPKQTYDIKAVSNSEITYSSENEFFASVSNNGIITGGRVGTTNIILETGVDKKTIKVTTISSNYLYPDPILDFGSSKSSIISKLGTPDYQQSIGNTIAIRYDNAPNTTLGTGYFFTDDKLTIIQTRVKSAYSSLLSSYLSDRFVPVAQSDGSFIFFNALNPSKITVGVSLTLYSVDYLDVEYIAFSSSSNMVSNIKLNVF